MRYAIIGHRGVGKSTLLRRIESYYSHENRVVECFDLDREIERFAKRPISNIFKDEGETGFRKLERETFRELDLNTGSKQSRDLYVACGAGFPPDLIPSTWKVLWIRRKSDEAGRIFTDRPRLMPELEPLEEFHNLRVQRAIEYAARADETLWIDEGTRGADESECGFILDELRDVGGAVTLHSSQFASHERLQNWIQRRVRWGVDWFELRDDLLSPMQMSEALKIIPQDRALISFRTRGAEASTAALIAQHKISFDWAIEMGACPIPGARFLSLHERKKNQTLTQALARFPKEIPQGAELKAALPVADFAELKEGHAWREIFPEARIFLPLSEDGRWSWYRLLQSGRQSLGFFKDSEASGADQPTFLQWVRTRRFDPEPHVSDPFTFAAVLGDPVSHSRTPMEQADFFATEGEPVFSIRVTEHEWREQNALSFLQQLGLTAAAVTAPLKHVAYEVCQAQDRVSEALRSINTISWQAKTKTWIGTNTDLTGFREAIEDLQNDGVDLRKIAVWGGGGTLAVVKAVLPKAEFFSARVAENRNAQSVRAADFKPDTVIWCLGRSRKLEAPPQGWRPSLIIDLNYSEDSPGREYALKLGCSYISGLAMFLAQAEAQRRFWSRFGSRGAHGTHFQETL